MALKLRPVNKKPETLTVSRAPTNRLIPNRLRLSLPPPALFPVNSYFIDSLMNLAYTHYNALNRRIADEIIASEKFLEGSFSSWRGVRMDGSFFPYYE